MTDNRKDRLLELLADQMLFGLSEQELMELKQSKIQFPDWNNFDNFEAAAAAIGLSNLKIVPLPDNLRSKILADSASYLNPAQSSQNASNYDRDRNLTIPVSAPKAVRHTVPVTEKRPFWQWLGWGFAAAACALLIANLWLTRFQKVSEIAKNPQVVETPVPQLTESAKRDQLVSAAPDLVKSVLETPKGAQSITGEVVWSNSLQKGYVTFRGLPANDPAKETYQLWIVDENQDPKTPVNGGIFNAQANGEIIVPINAELKIKKPKLFAVTQEKPGGVVVSKQEKLIAFAKI